MLTYYSIEIILKCEQVDIIYMFHVSDEHSENEDNGTVCNGDHTDNLLLSKNTVMVLKRLEAEALVL